jgi:hypothetical protein
MGKGFWTLSSHKKKRKGRESALVEALLKLTGPPS